MKHCFSINAEGGPILLADALSATQWRGAANGGDDYQRLSARFDTTPDIPGFVFVLEGNPAIAWEMAGPGTADVFQDATGVIRVVRAWLNEDSADELERLALFPISSGAIIGEISVPCGRLAVLWAPESGKGIANAGSQEYSPIKGTALDQSGFVMNGASAKYSCQHDEVKCGLSMARRITLTPA